MALEPIITVAGLLVSIFVPIAAIIYMLVAISHGKVMIAIFWGIWYILWSERDDDE